MADRDRSDDGMRRLYEDVEQRTAQAMEELVRRDSFGELVARMTENVMGMSRIGFDVLDLVVRNLRIAGRQDVTRLGRQVARTEDKLEMVLQAVERLENELAARDGASAGRGARSEGGSSGGGRSSGSRKRASSSKRSSSSAGRSSAASGPGDQEGSGEGTGSEESGSPSGSLAP